MPKSRLKITANLMKEVLFPLVEGVEIIDVVSITTPHGLILIYEVEGDEIPDVPFIVCEYVQTAQGQIIKTNINPVQ